MLHSTVAREAGQTVTFFEQADGELARLGSIRGGTGAIRYTVGEARSKARQIVAEVYQGRVPRARLIVARYSAANPPPGRSSPGAARGVPRGDSWTRAALGQTHFRARRTGTGLCLLLVATRGRTRVTFNGLARGEGLTVRVVARSPGGPPSTAP